MSRPDPWKPAVRVVPARLPQPAALVLVLLLRSSWLTVEAGRQIGAAGVLHRRGGRAALAVSVAVAVGVPNQQSRPRKNGSPRVPQVAQRVCRALGRQCSRSPHGREPDRLHRRHFRFEVVSGGLLRGLRCSTVGPGVAHCRDGRPPFTLRLASLAHPTTAPRTRKPPSTAAQRTRSRSARLPSARPRSTPGSPCPARSPAPALAAP